MSAFNDSGSDGNRRRDDWIAAHNIERLIDQELSANPPYRGKTARESSSVQTQPELFDDVTGRRIFG